ncbi:MAG: hypothetical protein WDN08_11940 [Rhizomicrobium sp.]
MEALKAIDLVPPHAPGVSLQRAYIVYATTGTDRALQALGSEVDAVLAQMAPADALALQIVHLRQRNRIAALKDILAAAPSKVLRVAAIADLPVFGIAGSPIESERGWIDLLLGDKRQAAKSARAVRAFAAGQIETPWNRWFLCYLTAQAHLLAGEAPPAAASARQALALAPGARCVPAEFMVARVLAWAGAEDEALALLERAGRRSARRRADRDRARSALHRSAGGASAFRGAAGPPRSADGGNRARDRGAGGEI